MNRTTSILLVRHAKAEEEHAAGDWARGLTERGRESFRRHAIKLSPRVRLRGIVSSPLARSVQTAEILAAVFRLPSVHLRAELLPGPRSAARHLALMRELEDGFALVSHNPSLEKAAALLVGEKKLDYSLKKGSVLALRTAGKGWAFDWLAIPGQRIKELAGAVPQVRRAC